jgi:hypothetical protein
MASIISLTDAKAWLRYPNPSAANADDAGIQGVIDAAKEIIESHVGVTVPRMFTETYSGGTSKLYLRHTPVLSIAEITESWGVVNFELNDQPSDTGAIIGGTTGEASNPPASNVFAYSLDVASTGEVTRRGPGNVPLRFAPSDNGIRVTYTAGRNPIPAAIALAAKELVSHIWQNSELRSNVLSGAYLQYDTTEGITRDNPAGAQGYWVGVPRAVISLLESEMTRLPFMA